MAMYLDEARVRALLHWDALIAAMESALAGFSSGRVIQPVRNVISIEEGRRYLGITKSLAPPAGSVLALLGSGVQAQAHLEALSSVCSFRETRVWSRTADHAKRFAAEHGAVAMDAESAVRGADVIVTAKAPIYAEAGEIFAARVQRPEGVTTIFKSVGIAVEDVAAARLVFAATGAKW